MENRLWHKKNWRRGNAPIPRQPSPYWDGEHENEKMLRELLESRRHTGLSLAVNVVLGSVLLLLAVAFVWLCAAMGD